MSLTVGDEIIVYRGKYSCTTPGSIGVIHYITPDKSMIKANWSKLTGNAQIYEYISNEGKSAWYISIKDIRKVTKLDKALK